MGEFSGEFVNIRRITTPETPPILHAREEPPPAADAALQWRDFATFAETNTTALQRKINEVHRSGGGYIYFTPGRYYIGRNVPAMMMPEGGMMSPPTMGDSLIDWSLTRDVPDVLVPPNVTLRFAPGAVLVPMNYRYATGRMNPTMEGRLQENDLVRIEIQGAIIADMREIFATNVYPNDDYGMSEEHPLPAGKILLTGNRIREVYPEWWGAFSGQEGRWPKRHVRSLQAAIDAAHTDRHRPERLPGGQLVRGPQGIAWVQLPTIPVVAAYSYVISGPLTVGRTSAVEGSDDLALRVPNPAPFVLRGERETSQQGKSTFSADGSFADRSHPSYEQPLLRLAGSPFVLERVHFHGQSRAASLVAVEPMDGGTHEFSGCVFEEMRLGMGAVAVQVVSGPIPLDDRTGERITPRSAQLTFSRCRLVAVSPSRTDDLDHGTAWENVPAPERSYPRGMSCVSLDVEDHVGVVFNNCFTLGLGDPLILARRGRFTLNECTFHASRTQYAALPTEGMGERVRAFLNNSDGTDIHITTPPSSGGIPWAPASFTARAIESQSFQFLSSFRDEPLETFVWPPPPPPSGSESACVLLKVNHGAAWGGAKDGGVDSNFDRRLTRPSIAWDGPARYGSMLVAVGCAFRWDYVPSPTPPWHSAMGAILLGPGADGAVYHLGNTVRSWIGEMGIHAVPSGPMAALSMVQPRRIIAVASTGATTRIHALGLPLILSRRASRAAAT